MSVLRDIFGGITAKEQIRRIEALRAATQAAKEEQKPVTEDISKQTHLDQALAALGGDAEEPKEVEEPKEYYGVETPGPAQQLMDLGDEIFGNVEGTAINYRGENYYKACSEFVADTEDGGQTFCMLPAMMPHEVHSDYRGITTERTGGVLVSFTAHPRSDEQLKRVLEQVSGIAASVNEASIPFTYSVYAGDGDDS